jgi:hypothetical protein
MFQYSLVVKEIMTKYTIFFKKINKTSGEM